MGKIGNLSRAWVFGAAFIALPAAAQPLAPNYELTRPADTGMPVEWDGPARGPGLAWGSVRMAAGFATMGSGAGLSLEAGQQWFARVGVGRSLDASELSLGGGYRWRDGQALSLQLVRGLSQERLGLAVRYDWPSYYLRLGYDTRLGPASTESLRFSAGIRF